MTPEFYTDGTSVFHTHGYADRGEPFARLADYDGPRDSAPLPQTLPRGAWRNVAPTLVIHPQFGLLTPLATDGVRVLVWLDGAHETVQKSNCIGPIGPRYVSVSEWNYKKNVAVFPPHLCADGDCPEPQCVERLLWAGCVDIGSKDGKPVLTRVGFGPAFASDDALKARIEQICKENKEKQKRRQRKARAPQRQPRGLSQATLAAI